MMTTGKQHSVVCNKHKDAISE